ncbi:D-tagatose-bisphosphate aldolase, class II, non-catalytic subunit [Lichenihabitans sp. Uapishka_5]|uniref:D-tagatose-bisphosphate aldolase, class II, non-catalytic subunit n=1 Tax=Lichenihabitans sp. Uapishka_5 TaxID=3037302 RepID=UPI0029E7D07B|nr:D-tagatose-bisphosphate aldolase, class II, non-catalytic subunit [Lichenihabitans sp. Uapishka_5]MDX7950800.1 D-tagatose-bisphosphate aldolase, class II, non-catalytic subunit [Lichenihabitans sp. Uapishka_5]
MIRPLPPLLSQRLTDDAAGITSVCTAHPIVIEATLAHGLRTGRRVLIEATCNQVNQEGGYTGMTPAAFRGFVEAIAAKVGFDPARIILGGDHLGPNPWKHLSPGDAMGRALTMIGAYAQAGFSKLHLDTSMGCAGEPAALADAVTAERAAALASAAEAEVGVGLSPVYVIGTEVPVPGGAQHALDTLAVTRPEAAFRTLEVHRQAFRARGRDDAFARVIGVVVQPGVEFGSTDVIGYQPVKAEALAAALDHMPGLVFEAHSTDYQSEGALAALVRDGFAILKVGPWLTFALREALYGLDAIAGILPTQDGADPDRTEGLPALMEALMVREPEYWRNYYAGDADALRLQRHYSFSDRIRYYWPHREAQHGVERLFARLGDRPIPGPLVSQHLGKLYGAVADGSLAPRPRDLAIAAVQQVLDRYDRACHATPRG